MKDSTAKLQQTLHDDIPLTREMGITVAAYDGRQLRLAAPLAPNLNHKCTAFGGSLYSLAVLCGWGLLHLKLEEAGLHRHIVIQEADIEYLLPVAQDMEAECEVDDAALQRFMAMLQKHGRSRLSLEVAIKRDGHAAVKFSGRYVVHE
ncbi:MAG: thioesterase domain-containing protein [Pseudomonadota bacterium]